MKRILLRSILRRDLVPIAYTILRHSYSLQKLQADLFAGLTVAVVALPLAMALAIASGVPPSRGLYTAIVAGFLISALGGSRHQIGGPTGAFVVVVFGVVQEHGYDGLAIATLMAGAILVVGAFARLGAIIKYVPYPVVTGFTAGIAVVIFSSQIKDLFGLSMDEVPVEMVARWAAYIRAMPTMEPVATAVAALTLVIVLGLRRWRPTWPAFLIAVMVSGLLAAIGLPLETIGSRFGGIPAGLPVPELPEVTWARMLELVPAALTIAFLAGIESLLSAAIADGMTGTRHRPNAELMGQGIANIGSALFGGIPATGALARTAANIKSGGRTPVAGMSHAVFLLLFMWLLGGLADSIPLAALAAVLVVVAWNMSEIDRFRRLLRAPPGDRLVLLITFALTVLVDITVAVQVGVALAGLLFMRRMVETSEVVQQVPAPAAAEIGDDEAENDEAEAAARPPGVEVFRMSGPFFFGAADRLNDVLDRVRETPRVFVLRMGSVPFVDATGAHALAGFIEKCRGRGTEVILAEVKPQPREVLARMGVVALLGADHFVEDADAAARFAAELAGEPPA